jgi:hypothetical protein
MSLPTVLCPGVAHNCRRWFGIGLVLHQLPRAGNGGAIPPEDYLIPSAPADPMPVAELNAWRRGERMHRVEYPESQ